MDVIYKTVFMLTEICTTNNMSHKKNIGHSRAVFWANKAASTELIDNLFWSDDKMATFSQLKDVVKKLENWPWIKSSIIKTYNAC